jgi:AcrR family transcriptional regulator
MVIMGRWLPDARGRMMAAALELYAERGYEQTTVDDIAERAGVTQRTFFRYFADKREVLFDGAAELQTRVLESIASAPSSASPIEVMGTAMEVAAALLQENRDYAQRRAAVVSSNPSLHERELLKLASLGVASAAALRARGVPDPAAGLAAEAGVTVFKVAFERWIADPAPESFTQCVRDALGELKGLTGGT